jgi:hypothetical protein
VPDLRGQFLRGAAALGDTLLDKHQWTTGKPRNDFITGTDGLHHHTTHHMKSGMQGGPWEALISYNNVGVDYQTTDSGAHWHHITQGGDTETAPDHVRIHWCIKAQFATLVPANSLRVNLAQTIADGDLLSYDGATGNWRGRQWTSVGPAAPVSPHKGFSWFNTDREELQVFDGSKWVYASTPHWEADVTMGVNAGTVGNQVLLAKGIQPQNDGIYISITDTQVGHSAGRAAYALHAFSTDSTGSAKAAALHLETTNTRFSKLHWFWKDTSDGYVVAATISEACTGAVYRVGMMSPTAPLHAIHGDGNTLATDTSSGTTIDLTSTSIVTGVSQTDFDNAVKAAAARVFPSVAEPTLNGTAGTPSTSFNWINYKPGAIHRWIVDVDRSAKWVPVLYLESNGSGTKSAKHEGLLFVGTDQFALDRTDDQGGPFHSFQLGWGDTNNSVSSGNIATVSLEFYEITARHFVVVKYRMQYRRKTDDKPSICEALMYVGGQDTHPLTGRYGLSSFAGDTPYELRQY